MSSRTTWIGVAGSATAKLSLGKTLGFTSQYVHLYNCESPLSLQQPCTIVGELSGVVAHAGLGTSIVVVTDVHHKGQFDGLKSTGWDFAIDVGAKVGEAGKAVVRSRTMFDAMCDALKAAYNKKALGEWLASEVGKSTVNAATNNLALGTGTPSLAVWGTPVGSGLGVGVWYEWQTLYLAGTRFAWDKAQITWRLVKHGSAVWLQMRGIPEPDGTQLSVLGKQFHTLYPDGIVRLCQPGSRRLNDAEVVVRGGEIFELAAAAAAVGSPPDGGGINLSARHIDYVTNFPYQSAGFIDKDEFMRLGFALSKNKRIVWTSGDATRVHFSHTSAPNLGPTRQPGTRSIDKMEPHYWTQ